MTRTRSIDPLGAVLGLVLLAAPLPAAQAAGAAVPPPADARLDEDRTAADALTAGVRTAYMQAPALVDDVRWVLRSESGDQLLDQAHREGRCRFDGDEFEVVAAQTGDRVTRQGDWLTLQLAAVPERAVRVRHEGDHDAALRGVLGGDSHVLPFQALLRDGAPWSRVLQSLAPQARGLAFVGLDEVGEGAARRVRLRYTADGMELRVDVDPRRTCSPAPSWSSCSGHRPGWTRRPRRSGPTGRSSTPTSSRRGCSSGSTSPSPSRPDCRT